MQTHSHGLYHEQQRGNQCLTHAFNSMVGEHVISGSTLSSYSMQSSVCALYQQPNPEGPFNEGLLNHWLYTHCEMPVCLVRYHTTTLDLSPCNRSRMYAARKETHCNRFILMQHGGVIDHASHLAYHNGEWWHIDSMQDRPITTRDAP